MKRLRILNNQVFDWLRARKKRSHSENQRSSLTGLEVLEPRMMLSGVVEADYQNDYQVDEQPAGWQYLWNAPEDWNGVTSSDASGQRFGNPENYQSLQSVGKSYRPRGETAIDLQQPDRFLRLSPTGGNVGAGFQQTASNNRNARFAIAAWTVQESGYYEIADSFLTTSDRSDGIDVVIHVNDQDPVVRKRLSGKNKNFDAAIGYLHAGDVIYVGFGGGATADHDSFRHDFSIVRFEGPGFAVLQSDGSTRVSEPGTSDSLMIQLYEQPESEVVIEFDVSDASELAVDRRRLIFNSSNWQNAQTITVSGVDDNLADGSSYTLLTAKIDLARSDQTYHAVHDQSFVVVNQDDELRQSLSSQIGAGIVNGWNSITVIPGVYELTPVAEYAAHLYISNAEDVTIVADGVTVIATELNTGIVLQDSEDVTLRGLTVDYADLPFTQGTITQIASDGSWLEVQIHQGYALPGVGDSTRAVVHVSESGQVKPNTASRYNSTISSVAGRTVRVQTFAVLDDAQLGDFVSLTRPIRTPHAVWVNRGERIRVEDVTVHASTSFAFFETSGDANVYYNVTVTPGDRPVGASVDRLLSSNYDAFHSKNAKLGPRIEQAYFSSMGDDGVAINGDYSLLVRNDGDSIVLAKKWNLTQFEVGDRLRAYSDSTGQSYETTVTGISSVSAGIDFVAARDNWLPDLVRPDNLFLNGVRLTLSQALPNDAGDLVMNLDRNGEGFQVLDSVIENTRARGLALKAGDGLVAGNTIQHVATAGILISPESRFWMEAGFATSLTIRDNQILDVGFVYERPYSLDGGGIAFVADPSRDIRGHRDITIENNLFDRVVGANITLSNASGVTVAGNWFRQPYLEDRGHGEARGVQKGSLVWVTNSDNIFFDDNLIERPGAFLNHPLTVTSSVSIVNDVNGFRDVSQPTQVAGRSIAYGGSTAYGELQSDPTMQALLPGEVSGVNNFTNYDRGLNRVLIDLINSPRDEFTVDDFEFRVGNSGDPDSWTVLSLETEIPLPQVVTIDSGSFGMKRIVLEWPDNVVVNTWLQVTIKANGNTGLAADDVFYFGNQVGNVADFDLSPGKPVYVNVSDVRAVLRNLSPDTQDEIGNEYDIDRNGRVDQQDADLVLNNFDRQGGLRMFIAPSGQWMV